MKATAKKSKMMMKKYDWEVEKQVLGVKEVSAIERIEVKTSGVCQGRKEGDDLGVYPPP